MPDLQTLIDRVETIVLEGWTQLRDGCTPDQLDALDQTEQYVRDFIEGGLRIGAALGYSHGYTDAADTQ